MYAIKINKSGRFVVWCDEHWYETESEPVYIFTKERAEQIAKQLKEHYVYAVTLMERDGESYVINALAKENPMKAPVEKKGFGTISMTRLRSIMKH